MVSPAPDVDNFLIWTICEAASEIRNNAWNTCSPKHPIGFVGKPEDVGWAMLFLASDESSFIPGVALPVDDGRSIR
jgi:NAD(P)-dependent dehydrogenase (short-subunit alcohol dehydrogenase family)